MSTVTNTHKTAVGLPNGVFLQPNVPTFVPDWPEISQNLVVKAWVRAKILVVDGAGAAKPEPMAPLNPAVPVAPVVGTEAETDTRDEKDKLLDELLTYGIDKNRRSSMETLQALLDDAKAKVAASSAEGESGEADA